MTSREYLAGILGQYRLKTGTTTETDSVFFITRDTEKWISKEASESPDIYGDEIYNKIKSGKALRESIPKIFGHSPIWDAAEDKIVMFETAKK